MKDKNICQNKANYIFISNYGMASALTQDLQPQVLD